MLSSIMRRHLVHLGMGNERRGNRFAALLPWAALLVYAPVAHAQDMPGMPGAPGAPGMPGSPSTPGAPRVPAPSTPAEPIPPTTVGPGGPPATLPAPAEPAPLPPPPSAPPASPPSAPAPASPGSAAFELLPDSPDRPAPAAADPAKPARTSPAAARAAAAPTTVPIAPREPAREPPPTAAPYAYQPQNHQEPEATRDESWGLLGPIRLGFLLGTGLPEILSIGGQIKLTKYFGAGINVGLIPTVKISYYGDATMKYQEYDLYGRIYPFGGAFFLGAGVGYASIDGTLANRFNLGSLQAMYPGAGIPAYADVNSEASVRTLVLTPQIGFMKIFGSGFAIGIDVGAQIPIAPSSVEFTTAAPQVPAAIQEQVRQQYLNPNDQKVRDTLEKVGRTPLPTIGFRIGWFL